MTVRLAPALMMPLMVVAMTGMTHAATDGCISSISYGHNMEAPNQHVRLLFESCVKKCPDGQNSYATNTSSTPGNGQLMVAQCLKGYGGDTFRNVWPKPWVSPLLPKTSNSPNGTTNAVGGLDREAFGIQCRKDACPPIKETGVTNDIMDKAFPSPADGLIPFDVP